MCNMPLALNAWLFPDVLGSPMSCYYEYTRC